MSPKFDPSKPFTVIDSGKEKSKKKPKFDPSQEFTILSGDEVAPREDDSEISNLGMQKDVADFTRDMSVLGVHGVSQGFSDELTAGVKTGSFSSPEYVTERNIQRDKIAEMRDRSPILGSLAEATGSVASTAAFPLLRGAPVVKGLLSAGLQGVGEARDMEDIPREAAKSALIQGGMELGGKALKKVVFDDPTKILTRSIGTTMGDVGGDTQAKAIKATSRLKDAGFFKQGADVYVTPGKHSFQRTVKKSLDQFFKPLTEDDLYKRATDSISTLVSRNKDLLKGKMVPSTEFKRALYEGVLELSYDPKAFDVVGREQIARDLVDVVERDLRMKSGWSGGGPIPASDVELAKQSLDAYMGDPAFDKRLLDLGISKQGMMKFRTKLDDVLDSHKIGGVEYKKNNDMLSDLITVRDILDAKEAKSYVDTGTGRVNVQNWWESTKDVFSPTYVDIARSGVSELAETPAGEFTTKVLKRAPVERFTGRNPQSIGRDPNSIPGLDMTPMEVVKARLPRTTQGLIQNKDLVIAKLAASQVPSEMIDSVAQALNDDPESVEAIAPMVAMQFPQIFEKSKYKMFDGRLIDPNERAKAADATSKRDDLGSLQKAKIINELNKSGKWLGE